MFIRKKPNKSGSISVQIIEKCDGKYHVRKTVGSSDDGEEIARLVQEARSFLAMPPRNQPRLFPLRSEEDNAIETFLHSLTNAQVRTKGPEIIFGTLFDRIGFNLLPDTLFRHITIARLAFPTSKVKTADYLYRFQGERIDVSRIYRFLDTLRADYKDTVERVAFEYTKKTVGEISVVFYDMTTLYFETEDEDDLRKIGFSKDGKFQQPQIMIGLLVGEGGFPIGYDIFSGNTFEGHTLIPTLEKIEKKYGFGKPVVIADAGLLSKTNIQKLREAGYGFILGARIKNETTTIQETILTWAKEHRMDGNATNLLRPDDTKLIVSYTDKRARKDAWNRERGLKKLRLRVASGRLTKEQITNRGYNKFLKLEGNVTVSVDEDRVKDDAAWDGLKGYLTNTKSTEKRVMERYRHLWHIEEAFRISKTDLRVRPVFHYKRRRIEAHLCIAFVAYTIWKELERLLKCQKVSMSPKRAGELTQNMYEIAYVLPGAQTLRHRLLGMDDEQKKLLAAVNQK